MRTIIMTCLVIAISGCASDKRWLPPGGGLYGRSTEQVDDTKCRELGFKPGSEAYGNCRLKLEEVRAIKQAAVRKRQREDNIAVAGPQVLVQPRAGRKVYSRDECVGPVVMGQCKGTILPKKAYHPTCHGDWLNGQCTGPMF